MSNSYVFFNFALRWDRRRIKKKISTWNHGDLNAKETSLCSSDSSHWRNRESMGNHSSRRVQQSYCLWTFHFQWWVYHPEWRNLALTNVIWVRDPQLETKNLDVTALHDNQECGISLDLCLDPSKLSSAFIFFIGEGEEAWNEVDSLLLSNAKIPWSKSFASPHHWPSGSVSPSHLLPQHNLCSNMSDFGRTTYQWHNVSTIAASEKLSG